MQILAIDTASPAPSVTLLARGSAWEEGLGLSRPQSGRVAGAAGMPPSEHVRASEELLPAIERCFEAAGARLVEVDRIAVCSGPGSFTGLRIGLATAWGLGRAAGIPVETVSTLEALAETVRARGILEVATALDAGRGEVVLAVYSLRGDRARLTSDSVRLSHEDARERTRGLRVASLPPDLVTPRGEKVETSPSRALAQAVARAPGETALRLAGVYSRPSAAEDKRGAP